MLDMNEEVDDEDDLREVDILVLVVLASLCRVI